MVHIIPMPASITATGETFTLADTANIHVEPGTDELVEIGQYLADRLNPSTGYGMQVLTAAGAPAKGVSI
jgi:hexosaminidase